MIINKKKGVAESPWKTGCYGISLRARTNRLYS